MLLNRIAYTLLLAYTNMKKVVVNLTPADLSHFIEGYTNNGKGEYLLVDVDSHMTAWMNLEYRAGYRPYYKNIPILSIENVGRFSLMTDLPAYESLKGSLILVANRQ